MLAHKTQGSNSEVGQVIAGTKFVSFLTPNMASAYPSTKQIDAMSGIVFWRHVWHQKAAEHCTFNQLPNFGIRAFKYTVDAMWLLFKYYVVAIRIGWTVKGLSQGHIDRANPDSQSQSYALTSVASLTLVKAETFPKRKATPWAHQELKKLIDTNKTHQTINNPKQDVLLDNIVPNLAVYVP